MVITIYRQAVIIIIVAAEVQRDGVGGVSLVLVKEEADVAVARVGGDFPAVWGLVPDHVMLAEEGGVFDVGGGCFG